MLEHYFAAHLDTARVREAARKAHRRAVQEHAVASLRAQGASQRGQRPVPAAAARPPVEQAPPEPTAPPVIAAQVADA